MALGKTLTKISLITALYATTITACGGGGGGGSKPTPVNNKPVITILEQNPLIEDQGNICSKFSVTDADNDAITTSLLANGNTFDPCNYTGLKRGIYSGDSTLSATDGKDTTTANFDMRVVSKLASPYKITGIYTDQNSIPGVNNVYSTDINSLVLNLKSNSNLSALETEVTKYANAAGISNIVDTWYSPDTNEIIMQEKNAGQLKGTQVGSIVYQTIKLPDSQKCDVTKAYDPTFVCP